MNPPVENILKKFKYENDFSNSIKYSIFLIAFLILLLFYILFKVKFKASGNINKNSQTAIKDTFIIVFFGMLIVSICILLLPNFKNLRELFNQISNVTYVIIYTMFLILFFSLTPKNILNDYAHILTPITIFIGFVMFYKSFQQNYVDKFDVNYERIKMMILFFCLFTIYIIYYNTDPGGYIQKTFGYSLLLTIIISVFVFIYLIFILTLPDIQKDIKIGDNRSNFLENFTPFMKYNSIAFIIFIIIVTITISTYPGGFFNDKAVSTFSMALLLSLVILWSILLGSNLFSDAINSSDTTIIKRSMLVLLWIIILSLVIFWLVYNIDNLTNGIGIFKFILNLLLILVMFGLIYKTINVKLPLGNTKKNAFFSLITNILLYIPCLVGDFFDWIGKIIAGEQNASEAGTFMMLIISICLLVIYFTLPSVFNRFYLQGGKQLVNKPIYTDTQYSLGSYINLNDGNEDFNYQYSLSCWVFIDSVAPNTNPNYNKYTSLLNFGNKPNVLYNGKTHTLMITMEQKNLKDQTKNKLIDFDENGNRIIYTNNNFLLQKWNNIIINYNGGTMDIFLNGELVKSSIEVVPYYTYDNLVIGENDGIKGGICNIVYFKRALNSPEIYLLYNLVKNNTPPVLSNSNETIMVNNSK